MREDFFRIKSKKSRAKGAKNLQEKLAISPPPYLILPLEKYLTLFLCICTHYVIIYYFIRQTLVKAIIDIKRLTYLDRNLGSMFEHIVLYIGTTLCLEQNPYMQEQCLNENMFKSNGTYSCLFKSKFKYS